VTQRGRGTTLRALCNRLRWDERQAGSDCVLELEERDGVRARLRLLQLADVTEVLATGITAADGTFFPYHRVRTVRQGDLVLWRARERRAHGET
jgi:uncharacterized protein (UPF0248 family)